MDSGFCYSFAAPEKVENLNAVFSSDDVMFDSVNRILTVNIDITWSEPTVPNGVITTYEVTVNEGDTAIEVYNLLVPNVTESVMVLPYTNYTVSVAASTSAGQGDPQNIIVLSPEAGILCFHVHRISY